MSEAPAPPAAGKRTRTFRGAVKVKVKFAPENARRQGEITKLALLALGSSEAAMNLLNQKHDALGARPLDLATESDEGFAAVSRVILDLSGSRPGL